MWLAGCAGDSDPENINNWEWVKLTPSSSPPARFSHAMVYTMGPFIFGGADTNRKALGDTWEWDGRKWLERRPKHSPMARMGHAMAYDEERDEVVLFGGTASEGQSGGPTGLLSDTWIWNGSDWTKVTAVGPAGRWLHGMAYDSARKKVVLFGGQQSLYSLFNDTWEWDGARWVDVSSSYRPPGTWAHAMAYDHVWDKVMLFGGVTGEYSIVSDKTLWWHSNSQDWKIQGGTSLSLGTTEPVVLPLPRSHHAMAADSNRKMVVLFGGDMSDTGHLGDTWIWDGFEWQEWTGGGISPEPRVSHAMAYNWGTQEVFLFGGLSSFRDDRPSITRGDTWVYRRTGSY